MTLTLEQQTTSLELSKKLKSLNVKQESLWYWYHDDEGLGGGGYYLFEDNGIGRKEASAFTVAELGMILPKDMDNGIEYYETSWQDDGVILRFWLYDSNGGYDKEFIADTEANARAKALIWLIENNHIEV